MSQEIDRSGVAFESWLGDTMKRLRPVEGASGRLTDRVSMIATAIPNDPRLIRYVRAHLVPVAAVGLGGAAVLLASLALRTSPVPNPPVGGVPTTFDPSIEGPGIVTSFTPTLMYAGWVVSGVIAALAFWLYLGSRGSPRSVRLIAAMAMLIALAVTPLLNIDFGLRNGSAAALLEGFGVQDQRPFEVRTLYYETADPGQATTIMFGVRNEGPLPIRVDGIIGELGYESVVAAPWRAVWLSQDLGVSLERLRAFAPTTIEPGKELQLYLVGRAGPCAYGATFQAGTVAFAYRQIPTVVDVAVTIVGLSTSVPIQMPFDLAEPVREGCTG